MKKKKLRNSMVWELGKMKDEEASNAIETLRKQLISTEDQKLNKGKKNNENGVLTGEGDTNATDDLQKSRQTNPFYPTHIASAKYEKKFMVSDQNSPFHKTTQCFRTVPRKHVDHVDFKFDGAEHVSPDAYNSRFTQTQLELA